MPIFGQDSSPAGGKSLTAGPASSPIFHAVPAAVKARESSSFCLRLFWGVLFSPHLLLCSAASASVLMGLPPGSETGSFSLPCAAAGCCGEAAAFEASGLRTSESIPPAFVYSSPEWLPGLVPGLSCGTEPKAVAEEVEASEEAAEHDAESFFRLRPGRVRGLETCEVARGSGARCELVLFGARKGVPCVGERDGAGTRT